MHTPEEVRWRLRKGEQIVGYERHLNGRVWSSKDGLWWNGRQLAHDKKDLCSSIKDINNDWLFEGDVVAWETHSGTWSLMFLALQWVLVQDEWTLPLPANGRELRRVGFRSN